MTKRAFGIVTLVVFFCTYAFIASNYCSAGEGSDTETNVTYGYEAGVQLGTYAERNTFIGHYSGYSALGNSQYENNDNTAIGQRSGENIGNASDNTFIGSNAGLGCTGNMNTMIGHNTSNSIANGTGDSNVLIGDCCGENLGGSDNTFIGEDAGRHHESGDGNVFIGTNCGYYNGRDNQTSGDPEPGANNVFIGMNCGNNNTGSGNVFIGHEVGHEDNFINDSNLLLIDNEDAEYPLIQGDFANDELQINGILLTTGLATFYARATFSGGIHTTYCTMDSDQRFKEKIEPLEDAAETIAKLNGVSYFWKQEGFPEKNFEEQRQIGLIAQDVEKVLPEVVRTDDDGYKSIAYSQIVPVLIEAVKSQQQTIKQQQQQIDELRRLLESAVGSKM